MTRQRKQPKIDSETTLELIQSSSVNNCPPKSKKTSISKKKDKENNEPNCYSLFDFGSSVSSNNAESVLAEKDEEKSEKRERKTSRRTQNIVKESDVSVSGNKKDESDNAKTRGKHKNSGENLDEVPKSVSRKRGNKTVTERIGKNEEGKSKSKGKDKRIEQHDGTVEREIPEETSVQRKLKRSDITKYKLTEFPPAEKVMGSTRIQLGPVESTNPLLVEIVIDDKRYMVSSWSVKDGTYIQGLDSHYIVRNFRKGMNQPKK